MAEVVSIHRVRNRGGSTEPLGAVTVLANYGLQGDWRSHQNTGRQLTLIEEEALAAVGTQLGSGVPPGASRRQVVVRGIPLNFTVGSTLRIGPVVLAITGLCDPCENMEDTIGPGAREALRNRGGVCARVLEGGTLRVGDPLVVGDRPRADGGTQQAGAPRTAGG